MTQFRKLIDDLRGVTMIEYALIAALVAIAAITILTTMGTSISQIFNKVNTALTTA
jgi:pilus assembly protein Flp/PilA